MKTRVCITMVFLIAVFSNARLFSQSSMQTGADTSSFEVAKLRDTSSVIKGLTWGFGTTLNPLFQSEDIHSIPRLYISASPTLSTNRQKLRLEVEYGYKNSKASETQSTLVQKGSNRFDTVTVETSTQTTINRVSLGMVSHVDEIASNMFIGFGCRGGIMSMNLNKNIKSLGDRKFEDLQLFFEPIMEFEYIYEQKLGVSLQMSYMAFTLFDSEASKYSGSVLVPMSVEPLASRMNVLLNVHWYFMKK